MKTVGQILFVYAFFFSLSLSGAGFGEDRIINLRGVWKFTIGDNMKWASPNYVDEHWEDIYVPSAWEEEGFNGYDGYAWYRTTFEFEEEVNLAALSIELGYIDDVDEVYINGHLIGFSGSFPPDFYTAYNALRKYVIPGEVLNVTGPNVIAVRIYDTVQGGGIIKGSIGIYERRMDRYDAMQLGGIWKIRDGDRDEWKDPFYDDGDWQDAMVPNFWRSLKKFRPNRGVAWYRKEFTLPPNLRDEEELVVVLGKIDDFDKTYLNGHLIGFTNDNRRYGSSNSWQEYRIYVLLDRYLNRDGPNVLSVQVEDMGGNAGIYEGPIGICSIEYYEDFID